LRAEDELLETVVVGEFVLGVVDLAAEAFALLRNELYRLPSRGEIGDRHDLPAAGVEVLIGHLSGRIAHEEAVAKPLLQVMEPLQYISW
jgi:hypothetical protein